MLTNLLKLQGKMPQGSILLAISPGETLDCGNWLASLYLGRITLFVSVFVDVRRALAVRQIRFERD